MTETTPTLPGFTHTPSAQQQLIHEEFRIGTGNVVVVARAGVGKTTTAVAGVKFAPEAKVLLCAFNKKIADELNKRLGKGNAQAKTLHSVGMAAVMRFWTGLNVSSNGERAEALTNEVCGGTAPDTVKKLITKLHSLAREIAPHATEPEELHGLAMEFECMPDADWENEGYDLNFVCVKAVAAMELAATVKPVKTGIDFSDMIFLPVRNKWLTKQFDLVVVDEAQDMTIAQLEIAQGVCRGRIFVIGDDKQAIYAFRGADCNSLSRLKNELGAKELKLTQTFRCGKAIVREAQRLVPDFEAADDNHEGEVLSLHLDGLVAAAQAGDFILSRLNAPLVSIAMKLLRQNKRTRIAGRDIGKGLVTLIRKMKARSVPDLLVRINTWARNERTRLDAKFIGKLDSPGYLSRLDAINDQAEMLLELADDCKNVDEVIARIDRLFTNDGLGDKGVITCSSVHRAKGLETDRVFVLTDTLRDHNQEELNIRYVAITRAIHTLVYVRGN